MKQNLLSTFAIVPQQRPELTTLNNNYLLFLVLDLLCLWVIPLEVHYTNTRVGQDGCRQCTIDKSFVTES